MRSPRFIRAERDARRASARYILALAVALAACAEPAAPVVTAPPAAPAASADLMPQPGSALVAGTEYSWTTGQAPVYMGTDSGYYGSGFLKFKAPRVCYLTRISGKFVNTSELVITKVSNKWYLQGAGLSADKVGGRARCMVVAAASQEYYWETGWPNTKTNLLPWWEWGCYLTGIAGDFSSVYAEVRVYPSSDEWDLGPETLNQASYRRAWARCMKPLSGNADRVDWGQWTELSGLVMMSSKTTTVCVLFRLYGRLDHPSKYLTINQGTSNWYLYGSGLQWFGSHCYS